MKKYTTLIFDLFDTIVNFNFNNLPYVERNGVRSRTTGTDVYEVFKEQFPNISFDQFFPYFIESYQTFLDIKKEEFKEFPNRERFGIMLKSMGITPGEETKELEERMVIAHMSGLAKCVEFPEANRDTLNQAKEKGYRLGIVSNFDYVPTARMLIDKFSITGLFDSIIISGDVGWRKPKDIIFNKSLSELGVQPQESLFIGDNYGADIVGSRNVGMDGVWINWHSEPTKDLDPAPSFIVSALPEIRSFI